jgi:hypothetical protein
MLVFFSSKFMDISSDLRKIKSIPERENQKFSTHIYNIGQMYVGSCGSNKGHLQRSDPNGRVELSDLGRLGGRANTWTVSHVFVWVARCAQRGDP